MKTLTNKILCGLAVLALAVPVFADATAPSAAPPLEQKVRHELLMLPYFGVFDNLQFQVSGTNVTLFGQVIEPWTRSDAANVVKRIPGIGTVTNNIEVLPPSRMDNQIRFREAQAIYRYSDLYRYGQGSQPSIRIIVKNGHVTLDGVVDTEADRNIAGIRANGVPNVFSVTNNLVVNKS
jgi:hyperosmotically inducible protein